MWPAIALTDGKVLVTRHLRRSRQLIETTCLLPLVHKQKYHSNLQTISLYIIIIIIIIIISAFLMRHINRRCSANNRCWTGDSSVFCQRRQKICCWYVERLSDWQGVPRMNLHHRHHHHCHGNWIKRQLTQIKIKSNLIVSVACIARLTMLTGAKIKIIKPVAVLAKTLWGAGPPSAEWGGGL